jgi:hypothetical protein
LLIFGDAAQAHWKLQVGFVVAVTNPEAATDSNAGSSSSNYSKVPTFKVMKSLQVMSLGLCSDFGTCMVCFLSRNPKANEIFRDYVKVANDVPTT